VSATPPASAEMTYPRPAGVGTNTTASPVVVVIAGDNPACRQQAGSMQRKRRLRHPGRATVVESARDVIRRWGLSIFDTAAIFAHGSRILLHSFSPWSSPHGEDTDESAVIQAWTATSDVAKRG
jgi:hypothetical protein